MTLVVPRSSGAGVPLARSTINSVSRQSAILNLIPSVFICVHPWLELISWRPWRLGGSNPKIRNPNSKYPTVVISSATG